VIWLVHQTDLLGHGFPILGFSFGVLLLFFDNFDGPDGVKLAVVFFHAAGEELRQDEVLQRRIRHYLEVELLAVEHGAVLVVSLLLEVLLVDELEDVPFNLPLVVLPHVPALRVAAFEIRQHSGLGEGQQDLADHLVEFHLHVSSAALDFQLDAEDLGFQIEEHWRQLVQFSEFLEVFESLIQVSLEPFHVLLGTLDGGLDVARTLLR